MAQAATMKQPRAEQFHLCGGGKGTYNKTQQTIKNFKVFTADPPKYDECVLATETQPPRMLHKYQTRPLPSTLHCVLRQQTCRSNLITPNLAPTPAPAPLLASFQ